MAELRDVAAIEIDLAARLGALGLFVFGWCRLEAEDAIASPQKRRLDAWGRNTTLALIGNRGDRNGHSMWNMFSAAPEFSDGEPDAMNRWTQQVIAPVADELGAETVFPFGDEVWPFQRFAMRSMGVRPSPLGLLIHPQYGLWFAFRAGLVFADVAEVPENGFATHPCDACADKPCLSACPVSAFSREGFAVQACRDHLASGDDPDCMVIGCRARAACPIGAPYGDEQIRFHMKSFAGG